ncbi:hypothetical protein [Roseomonas sp. BN140053]|uniref:hypothetical protein n=1 Tax=Roseomonas sp. BN140053 TaxID=3391898 RepID=UPI0039EB5CF0
MSGAEHGSAASPTPGSITVQVPLAVRRRPGRKTIVTPAGVSTSAAGATPTVVRTQADPALVKALARAHRWKRLLDEGRYASLTELAAAEKLERGFLGRLLQLTLLAPDVVEAILDGRQAAGVGLPRLMEPFPTNWAEQHYALGLSTPPATEGHQG